MRIAVGSLNQAKIEAAGRAATRVIGSPVELVPIPADSRVSDQPHGIEETLAGARNRARTALERGAAELGIGFEGGLIEVAGQLQDGGLVYVVSKDGVETFSQAVSLPMPPDLMALVLGGVEVCEAIDLLEPTAGAVESRDATDYLTGGKLGIVEFYETPAVVALHACMQQLSNSSRQ